MDDDRIQLKKTYPTNSIKARINIKKEEEPPKKKVEKVVQHKPSRRKKSLGKKFLETFGVEDTQSVASYLLHDVLIPAAKNTLSEFVGSGIDMMLFGEARRGRHTTRDRDRSYVSYNSMSSKNRESRDRGRDLSRSDRAKHRFDDIVFGSRGEAEEVLSAMVDLIADYDICTVADFYDLSDITGSFTDNKWGWDNLGGVTVSRVRDGYVINLPRPIAVD